MNCLVIGCGSIGRRRADILKALGHEVGGDDTDPDALSTFKHVCVEDGWADVAVVCTPPNMRLPVVTRLMATHNLKGLFIEKPLALTEAEALAIVAMTDRVPVTMGACNMRFDHLAQGVRRPEESVFAQMGQHASYWSAGHEKITMLLDSIHELDLLFHLAGRITKIDGWSTLYEAHVVTEHENGVRGALQLDRRTSPPVRWIASDGEATSLWPPDPDMYVREMEHFIDAVECLEPSCNPLNDAAHVLIRALEVTDG